MKKIAIINQLVCDKSPFCPVKRVCPQKAVITHKGSGGFLFISPIEKYEIDPEKCTGCSICTNYCPMRAVEIKKAN